MLAVSHVQRSADQRWSSPRLKVRNLTLRMDSHTLGRNGCEGELAVFNNDISWSSLFRRSPMFPPVPSESYPVQPFVGYGCAFSGEPKQYSTPSSVPITRHPAAAAGDAEIEEPVSNRHRSAPVLKSTA